MTSIPPDATFRRSEGLTFIVHPCQGPLGAMVLALRQEGESQAALTMAEVRLLMGLSRWRRADELGVPHALLASLVERNCAFWSSERPDRDLTGEPLAPLEGPIALRDNVSVVPAIWSEGQIGNIPQMPRRGTLDGVQLAGNCFVVNEMDREVAKFLFNCCSRHTRMLADLVPRLDGASTFDELGPDADSRGLLRTLNDLGLLERHVPRRWNGRPQVTWLGHAGVLYEAAGRRLAVDPSAFQRSRPSRHPVQPFDPRDFGPFDAVLITHADNDHLHPAALERIDRRTPIVIPSARDPQPYQVDMRALLGLLGFTQVIEVDEWQRVPFGDVTVVATPFRGEDWGLSLPCRTYLIHSAELTVYLNADSTSTPEDYDRIAAEHQVDIAFLGVSGAAESYVMAPGFGYGDFYAPWIPPERANEWVQLTNGPREAAAAARRLRARHAFGYASGGASFYTLAYTDRGTHAELAALLREPGDPRPLELELGVPWSLPINPRSDRS